MFYKHDAFDVNLNIWQRKLDLDVKVSVKYKLGMGNTDKRDSVQVHESLKNDSFTRVMLHFFTWPTYLPHLP